jgi:hypothetical protein
VRGLRALLALGVAAGAGLAAAGGAAAAPPQALTVQARPGQVAKAAASLGAGALRVRRRDGNALQVLADPARARALARLPGVAAAGPSEAAFSDEAVVSQGLERTGADVLGRAAGGGAGLIIVVLDMGFGQNLGTLQAAGELPPPGRLETLSFDTANGLAGRNAYGNRTNHGEIVAQTVFDYAPQARYLFVNYHTEADFIAATDAVIARRPDIVVHSNSFLEGPFDGTGGAARAVDRAAAAGIAWFNSAGNYAQLSWSGPWADADHDGDLDWPQGDNWTFLRGAGQPITFALSWTSPPGGPPTDIDLELERLQPDGSWTTVASSADRQSLGAATAERIVGYLPPAEAFHRLRAVLVSGPPPAGPLTLFSREIPLAPIGGTVESSLPTPGDAAGAIAVGAVDWRGDALKSYSSQGPTDDGRLKPDVVAPTDTRIMGPTAPRAIGGTSNAAPNAAGAAAVMLAAARRAGQVPSAAEIRAQLSALALDLGAPGPDQVYGAGRVRVAVDPPRIGAVTPAPLAAVRGRVAVSFKAVSRSRIARWSAFLDGAPLSTAAGDPRTLSIDTRRLPDGFHALRAEARDFPGNVGARDWTVKVDNTPPVLIVRRVAVARVRTAQSAKGGPRGSARRRPRSVSLVVALADPGATGLLKARVTVRGSTLRRPAVGTVRLHPGPLRRVSLGRLAPGRYRATVQLSDRAGNMRTRARSLRVR